MYAYDVNWCVPWALAVPQMLNNMHPNRGCHRDHSIQWHRLKARTIRGDVWNTNVPLETSETDNPISVAC